eukprot:snap_masked-scaffold_21-processed-gene-0.13-mRNA-1 protein AED:1.00 eAED:1.00 QI:0/-1/0/0/-1/1/1/0/338
MRFSNVNLFNEKDFDEMRNKYNFYLSSIVFYVVPVTDKLILGERIESLSELTTKTNDMKNELIIYPEKIDKKMVSFVYHITEEYPIFYAIQLRLNNSNISSEEMRIFFSAVKNKNKIKTLRFGKISPYQNYFFNIINEFTYLKNIETESGSFSNLLSDDQNKNLISSFDSLSLQMKKVKVKDNLFFLSKIYATFSNLISLDLKLDGHKKYQTALLYSVLSNPNVVDKLERLEISAFGFISLGDLCLINKFLLDKGNLEEINIKIRNIGNNLKIISSVILKAVMVKEKLRSGRIILNSRKLKGKKEPIENISNKIFIFNKYAAEWNSKRGELICLANGY